MALESAAENKFAAIPGKALLIEVVTVADNVRGRHPDHLTAGYAVFRGTEIQRDDFAFDDPQIVAQFGTSLQYIDYGQKSVEETAADFQRQSDRILKRAMR